MAGPEVTLLAMNLSGRFAGREIRRFGETVIGTVLVEKDADVLFGQQANFKPHLPDHYTLVGGGTKAFLAVNKARIKACDEKQFRNKLRDLQFSGKLPFHYLPLSNFTLIKCKTRRSPSVEFIALSWLSDETQGRTRNLSVFKKLMTFVINVSALEALPVVIGGTFNISLEDASECLPEGYCVYGYIPDTLRRSVRAADFFVCPRSVRLSNVRPVLCSNLEFEDVDREGQVSPHRRAADLWLDPEDAFYCDPVRATLVGERQEAEGKLHARRFDVSLEEVHAYHDHRDQPDGRSAGSYSSMAAGGGERPAEGRAEGKAAQHGLLKKLPSCPDLYDDTAAENGTTCYMS